MLAILVVVMTVTDIQTYPITLVHVCGVISVGILFSSKHTWRGVVVPYCGKTTMRTSSDILITFCSQEKCWK